MVGWWENEDTTFACMEAVEDWAVPGLRHQISTAGLVGDPGGGTTTLPHGGQGPGRQPPPTSGVASPEVRALLQQVLDELGHDALDRRGRGH